MIAAIIRLFVEFFRWLRSFNERKRIVDGAVKDEQERVDKAKAEGDRALAEFDERERLRVSGETDRS